MTWILRTYHRATDELLSEQPLSPYLSNVVGIVDGNEVFVDYDNDGSSVAVADVLRQVIADFDALDYRKQRAVNVHELIERLRKVANGARSD